MGVETAMHSMRTWAAAMAGVLGVFAVAAAAPRPTGAQTLGDAEANVQAQGPAREPAQEPAPGCVLTWIEARYRNFGYDHLVHLKNQCGQVMSCSVTTSSNPTPIQVTLDPEQYLELLMFRGSPARTFTATVECEPPP
jgi:hypothetical protein